MNINHWNKTTFLETKNTDNDYTYNNDQNLVLMESIRSKDR